MLHAKAGSGERKQIRCGLPAATDAQWYCCLKIIDQSGQRYSVPDWAHLFDLSEATICSYTHRVNRTALAAALTRIVPGLVALAAGQTTLGSPQSLSPSHSRSFVIVYPTTFVAVVVLAARLGA